MEGKKVDMEGARVTDHEMPTADRQVPEAKNMRVSLVNRFLHGPSSSTQEG